MRESDTDADRDEREWFQRNVLASRLPHLHRAIQNARPPDQAADFEYQLDLLVAGLEHKAAAR